MRTDHPRSYRLSPATLRDLAAIREHLRCSATQAIESAVADYARRLRSETTMSTIEYYTIPPARLAELLTAAQAEDPTITEEELRGVLLADWSEGQEHQDWLNSGDVAEVIRWALPIVSECRRVTEDEDAETTAA